METRNLTETPESKVSGPVPQLQVRESVYLTESP